ncbi:sulfite exporter TauE/SafE family protein [Methylacidiphilum caldifontis]|uniref:Nickel transporter n=1 Tax=Methylacidiphilum caldifontis TaxID=2795386 RepID=A0A4Y8PFI6_9BACT|nr:nickel transporter [Methylacidiphilum caldifontis]QSR88413.1 nickel transporter [Methylacidiphilum caldifontis]TFE70711.1 nickel transporter [Methylacidiphilum caldifontis]
MFNLLIVSFVSGLLVGIGHALSGPDHLAALAPLTLEKKSGFWKVGLYWGLGHSGGIWILGIMLFFLRKFFPIILLSNWAERTVGLVLIGIGIWGIRRSFRDHLHVHYHAHDGLEHCHIHFHKERVVSSKEHLVEDHHHVHAPLGIGLLHGIAGSGHFFSALPVLSFPRSSMAITYILGFGLGAILGMVIFAFLLGKMIRIKVFFNRGKWLRRLFGSLAIGVGLFWVIEGGV